MHVRFSHCGRRERCRLFVLELVPKLVHLIDFAQENAEADCTADERQRDRGLVQ